MRPESGSRLSTGFPSSTSSVRAVWAGERGYIGDGVVREAQRLELREREQGRYARNGVVREVERAQIGQRGRDGDVREGVAGDVERRERGALGEGGDVREAEAAEVELRDVAREGDAAEANLLNLLDGLVGEDIAAGQRGGELVVFAALYLAAADVERDEAV